MVGPVMPSDSSARGVVSWRAAAPCPASAARWRAAAGDSPAARAVNQPTRNPASNASPAPVVSTAATVAVATSKRWLRSPARARTLAPFGPRLTIATGAKSSRPSFGWPPRNASASDAVAKMTSGPAAPIRARAARRPPSRSGPTEARSMLTAAPAARPSSIAAPAGVAQRNAEQRVDRQVHGGGPREPVRPAGRPAPAGPPPRGRPRTSAGRRAPRRPRSGPSARRRPGRSAVSPRRPGGPPPAPGRRRRARPPR